MTSGGGTASYCTAGTYSGAGRAQAWKPERAHHDSVTGRCVLKMDHYCVWLINCVGLLNYKAFLTFLLWAFLGSSLCSLLLALSFVRLFRDGAEAALLNLCALPRRNSPSLCPTIPPSNFTEIRGKIDK